MILNETVWSVLCLILTICLYSFAVFRNKDPVIGLTAIWIYVAINAKSKVPTIKTVCKLNTIIIGFFTLYSCWYLLNHSVN